MQNIIGYASGIKPLDVSIDAVSKARLDSLTKPLGSLGLLEDIVQKFIRITAVQPPLLSKKRHFVLAADHGIVAESVSAYPQEVTFQMVLNFLGEGAAINVLAKQAGCETVIVDMGVNHEFGEVHGLLDRKVRMGSRNFAKEPAMTHLELEMAILNGIALSEQAAEDGVHLISIGEMGIANTTSSTAIFAGLLDIDPAEIAGAGTGLDEAGIKHKAEVVAAALELHQPFENPLELLQKVGGYEIAGMVGIILGASRKNIPVVIDGFISTASAAIAMRLSLHVGERLFFAHTSHERGHKVVCHALSIEPILNLGLRLGEGSGAMLAIPIIDAAVKIYNDMASFSSAKVSDKT